MLDGRDPVPDDVVVRGYFRLPFCIAGIRSAYIHPSITKVQALRATIGPRNEVPVTGLKETMMPESNGAQMYQLMQY